jgi:SAF domain
VSLRTESATVPATVTARRLARPRWTDTRLLLGVLLVLGSVVVGSRVVASAQQTRPVWAAVRALPAGTVVRADDLVAADVRLDASGRLYWPVSGRSPVGLVVGRAVAAGELVPAAALADPEDEPAGHLVSVPVEVLHYPAGLGRGDLVDVYVSPADGAAAAAGAGGATGPRGDPQRVLARATVVEGDGDGARLGGSGTSAAVVLSVPDGAVPTLIGALRSGVVDLVLVAAS